MRFRVQVVRVADDGAEQTQAVAELERQGLVMESLGTSLAEGEAVTPWLFDALSPLS